MEVRSFPLRHIFVPTFRDCLRTTSGTRLVRTILITGIPGKRTVICSFLCTNRVFLCIMEASILMVVLWYGTYYTNFFKFFN